MKSVWKIAFVLALALVVVMACSQKQDNVQVQQAAPAAQEQAAEEQVLEEQAIVEEQETEQPLAETAQTEDAEDSDSSIIEISGTLVQTDEGVGLFSDSGNFLLDQDLSDMVGQNVRVTGSLDSKDGKPFVSVSSISIIE